MNSRKEENFVFTKLVERSCQVNSLSDFEFDLCKFEPMFEVTFGTRSGKIDIIISRNQKMIANFCLNT